MRPYLRAANVTWQGLALSDVKEMDFTEKESAVYELRPGDLLLAEASGSPGEVGKPALYQGEINGCCFQNTLIRVRVPGPLSPAFYEQFFREQAMNGRFAAGSRGVGIRHLGAKTLSDWSIPVPARAEQERIVTAIEEAFSKLDAGESGLRDVRQRLKRMRESVLTAAIVCKAGEPGAAWKRAALGSVLREPMRNGISAVKAQQGTGLPTFTLTAVTRGDFSERNIKYTVADPSQAGDLWAQPGDLFVQRSNTPELVGTTRLYRGRPRVAVFPDLLIRVRPSTLLDPAWLELFMQAPSTRAVLRAQARGLAGSMPKINQAILSKLEIHFPPLEEQERIVGEVERQMSFIEACEWAVDAGLVKAAALRRSVLKAAFEGKLVEQDPSDEPASVLLERIRAERASTPG